MASKTQCRNYVKDKNSKQNARSIHNELPDEIALRDEIFQLKRQIMLLKKANERNLIKVRKYEDEAKKKDRQIEQLMDPVKNGDVRKLLSMKGAALLLNLKEQNNTLIQMILDKDVQIRKLLTEIKTSKLYATSRRTESYRNEIDRLRNLLIKSQNVMKESQEMPQRRSICVGGTPTLEMTLSSDLSSPRDLEELQCTIQSLEMHMKYSNELLAKKNEQIVQLTEQLNAFQCSTCRKNIQTKYLAEVHNNLVGNDFVKVETFRETTEKPSADDILNSKSLFEKNIGNKGSIDRQRLANSAPAVSVRGFPDFTSRRDSNPCPNEGEGLVQDIKIHEFDKLDVSGHLTPGNSRDTERRDSTTDSEVDTAEFEMMERKIENDQIEIESPVKLTLPLKDESKDQETAFVTVAENTDFQEEENRENDVELQLNQNDEGQSHPGEAWGVLKAERRSSQISAVENPSIDMCFYDEEITTKSFTDFYRQTIESSFDSGSTTVSVHELQVEAEINHNSLTNSEQKEEEITVTTEVIDEDDDDDVVIR